LLTPLVGAEMERSARSGSGPSGRLGRVAGAPALSRAGAVGRVVGVGAGARSSAGAGSRERWPLSRPGPVPSGDDRRAIQPGRAIPATSRRAPRPCSRPRSSATPPAACRGSTARPGPALVLTAHTRQGPGRGHCRVSCSQFPLVCGLMERHPGSGWMSPGNAASGADACRYRLTRSWRDGSEPGQAPVPHTW